MKGEGGLREAGEAEEGKLSETEVKNGELESQQRQQTEQNEWPIYCNFFTYLNLYT